jgi:hypothetical protein
MSGANRLCAHGLRCTVQSGTACCQPSRYAVHACARAIAGLAGNSARQQARGDTRGEAGGKTMARMELISTAVTAFVARVLVLRAAPGVGNGTMLAVLSVAPVAVMLLLWDTFRTDQPTVRVRAHARGDRLWT